MSFVLYPCGRCSEKQLFVELNKAETVLLLVCSACSNSVAMPIEELPEFDVESWKGNDFPKRDMMYSKITPLYEKWNTVNVGEGQQADALTSESR